MNVVKLIKPIVRRGNDKSKVMRIILGGAHDKRPSFHFSLMENHAIKEQISIWADTNGHAHVIDEVCFPTLSTMHLTHLFVAHQGNSIIL
jgi:hypothetical protein